MKAETRKLRMALVGCGAVAEKCHLHTLGASPSIEVVALVDSAPGRAAALAASYSIPQAIDDYRLLGDGIDCALVAVPNALHAPVAACLLERGIHVLVEKPLAVDLPQCDRMIEAAAAGHALLGVAMVLRFTAHARQVREILAAGLLGELDEVDFEQGGPSEWPMRSDYLLRRDSAGGGVWIDLGSHAIDLLDWWLGELRPQEFFDDSHGGVESDCEFRFHFGTHGKGTMKLSRVRKLANRCVIRGERGELEVGVGFDSAMKLRVRGGRTSLWGNSQADGHEAGSASEGATHAFSSLHEDFAASIREQREPEVGGLQGRKVVGIIRECYGMRRQMVFPWLAPAVPPPASPDDRPMIHPVGKAVDALAGKRVLVTGASGFIGARLIERLAQIDACAPRALIRDFCRAFRIACFPIELVRGDVLEPVSLKAAMEDCDIVVHCAYGNSGDRETRMRINAEGAANVFEAALAAGVSRVVHLSTLVAYRIPEDGVLDESTPPARSIHDYADSKLEAENLARRFAAERGLPVVILQPTAVYGPHAPAWVAGLIERMKHSRIPLIDGGQGICPSVYIDDLVDAILLAAAAPERVHGEAFLISGPEPVTWKEFFGVFEELLGRRRTVEIPLHEALALVSAGKRARKPKSLLALARRDPLFKSMLRQTREVSAMKRCLRLLPDPVATGIKRLAGSGPPRSPADAGKRTAPAAEDPIEPLEDLAVQLYRSKAMVSIAKAADQLGYAPRFGFSEGMRLTGEWVKWARLC
jgi:predicted dehydrogenase/nucleoside-diphosphate-sugar epimerase